MAKIIKKTNLAEVLTTGADAFVDSFNKAMKKDNGVFTVFLSGGCTSQWLFDKLATDKYISLIDWTKVHVFWADERPVLSISPDSHYLMAYNSLLKKTNISEENIHRVKGELPPEEAVELYNKEIANHFNKFGKVIDLMVLSLGKDGHALGLFPNSPALNINDKYYTENNIATPKATRLTATYKLIERTEDIVFLITGIDYQKLLKEIFTGDFKPSRFPVQKINRLNENTAYIIDDISGELLDNI